MKIAKTYFMLMAADMDRAVAFWRDALGLKVTFSSPEWSELTSPGGGVVALHGGGTGEEEQTGLGFDVDDTTAGCDSVVAAGGRVARPPQDRPGEGIRLADVVDTEGNRFMLSQSA